MNWLRVWKCLLNGSAGGVVVGFEREKVEGEETETPETEWEEENEREIGWEAMEVVPRINDAIAQVEDKKMRIGYMKAGDTNLYEDLAVDIKGIRP